jgi:uncharacterized membrane protein
MDRGCGARARRLFADFGVLLDRRACDDIRVACFVYFHALAMLLVARLIRAPMFYLGVGSMANIGAAASAPVVAGAFHPALAVGVLLAVLGYALGTYGGWLSGQLMRWVGQ